MFDTLPSASQLVIGFRIYNLQPEIHTDDANVYCIWAGVLIGQLVWFLYVEQQSMNKHSPLLPQGNLWKTEKPEIQLQTKSGMVAASQFCVRFPHKEVLLHEQPQFDRLRHYNPGYRRTFLFEL